MRRCPKCKKFTATEDLKCSSCGFVLDGKAQASSGTLYAYELTSDEADAPAVSKTAVDDKTPPTGEPKRPDSGTLDPSQFNAFSPEPPQVLSHGTQLFDGDDDSEVAELPTANPASLVSGGTELYAEANDSELVVPSAAKSESLESDGTQLYTEENLRNQESHSDSATILDNPDGIKTNAVGVDSEIEPQRPSDNRSTSRNTPGPWAEEVGSSRSSLRRASPTDLPEASDSVFERIASRTIADANTEDQHLADYQIKERIGKGGMGVIFSAVQTAVNRIVAIKTIRSDKSNDPRVRRQFFYEAEITAKLDHPNIPPVFELATTADGVLFYSMRLFPKSDWRKVLPSKTQLENIEIFKRVLDAVSYSHSKNVIHRDIKPDNVILGNFGEVYLSDWGTGHDLSSARKIIGGGTPEYMAPEMARNISSQIGKHSDIYLLGAVLFEIVTGIAPHAVKNANARLEAAKANFIQETDIEDPFLRVARKAMSTNPEDRYRNAEEFRAAIDEVLEHNDSIDLAKRSQDIAKVAIAGKDYDRFNRAIFGLKEAIELWPANSLAASELNRVQLAFAQCAFERKDFDLALQNLDRKAPDAETLIGKVERAKRYALQRERRFKFFQRAFIGSLLVFLPVVSWLAYDASDKRNKAEKLSGELEQNNRQLKQQTIDLAESRDKEKEYAKIALNQLFTAMDATDVAERNFIKAQSAEVKAENEKRNAEFQALEAKKQLAKNRVTDAIKTLAFAHAQVNNFNPIDAMNLLKGIDWKEIESSLKGIETKDAESSLEREIPKLTKIPKLQGTWGYRRVELLGNMKESKLPFNTKVTAMDFAVDRRVGVVGLKDGTAFSLTHDGMELKPRNKVDLGNARYLTATEISPSGNEALMAMKDSSGNFRFARWNLQDKETIEETIGDKIARRFDGFGYSPDGQAAVAGISEGIWLRPNVGKEWVKLTNKIIGKLKSVVWTNNDTLWILSINENTEKKIPQLYALERASDAEFDPKKTRSIQLPDTIEEMKQRGINITAIGKAGNRLAIGFSDGNLWIYDIEDRDGERSLGRGERLEKKHKKEIKQIESDGRSRFVTRSDEPVAHAWRVREKEGNETDLKDEIIYDTYVLSAPGENSESNNIDRISLMSESELVCVDNQGNAAVLDIKRQQLHRQAPLDASPPPRDDDQLSGIQFRDGSDEVVATRQVGLVDVWDSQTWSLSNRDQQSAYFGHTPNAKLVDYAVDSANNLLVTSAILNEELRIKYFRGEKYMESAPQREFCSWNLTTGEMIDRWVDSRIGLPRLSALGNGYVWISSKDDNHCVNSKGEPHPKLDPQWRPKRDPYIAIPNPKHPNLVAMLKGNFAWIWDADPKGPGDADGFNAGEKDPRRPVPVNAIPLQAVWTSRGDRFYILDKDLKITVLSFDSEKRTFSPLPAPLDKRISLEGFEKIDKGITRFSGFNTQSTNFHDVDFGVLNDQFLYIVLRGEQVKKTAVGKLRLVDGNPKLDASLKAELEVKEEVGLHFLDEYQSDQGVDNDRKRVSSFSGLKAKNRRSVDGSEFAFTPQPGLVYRRDVNRDTVQIFGRGKLLSATADRKGDNLYYLFDSELGGTVRSLDRSVPEDNRWSQPLWHGAFMGTDEIDRIEMSPDGKVLVGYSKNRQVLRILDPNSGEERSRHENVAQFAWSPATWSHPTGPDANRSQSVEPTLAILKTDGSIVLSPDNPLFAPTIKIESPQEVKGIHFFQEFWEPGMTEIPPTPYLVIQTEEENSTYLRFFSADGTPKCSAELSKSKSLKIAFSPTESVLATGDSTGTIRLWFASPEYSSPEKGKGLVEELLDLKSESDSAIVRIAFSHDGDTLVTSDEKGRNRAWMSNDTLKGHMLKNE
jgi:serine/threonine protein kinase/WD40 repeat protein